MHGANRVLNFGNGRSKIGTFESCGHGDELLQVLAFDLILQRQLRNLRQRSQARKLAS